MSDPAGWEPLPTTPTARPRSRPLEERRLPLYGPEPQPVAGRFVTSPFTRLVRVQALSMGGDAMVAIALAGSLFFDISPQAARGKVALYLLLTLLPFSVVAPLVGPAVDRIKGGKRAVLIGVGGLRVALCVLMAWQLQSLALFPLAFLYMVVQKTYAVAKASYVPSVVRDDAELVEANGKLGVVAGVAGFVAALPALLLSLAASEAVLLLAAAMFVGQAVAALALPPMTTSTREEERLEARELHQAGVRLAASAMATLRAVVGFLTFGIAFWFRTEGVATAFFGLVVASSVLGTLTGNLLGSGVRKLLREESMLAATLALVTAAGAIGAFTATPGTSCLFVFLVGTAGAIGRLAFDAVVQRDAPDAARGQAFARFETRFQLAWVVAAFVPVLIPLPGRVIGIVVGLMAGLAGISYTYGWRRLQQGEDLPAPVTGRVASAVLTRVRRRGASDEHDEADGDGETAPAGDEAPPEPGAPLPPPPPSSIGRNGDPLLPLPPPSPPAGRHGDPRLPPPPG